ncbi:MAG: hypothetical protein V1718_03595, partial [archaeon]
MPDRKKKRFGRDVYVVPPGATLEDIIRALERKWPHDTLDLKNSVLFPKSFDEVLSYELDILPTDFELIKYSDEREWNRYGKPWTISSSTFDDVHSNLLKGAWPESLRRRKKFLAGVKKSRVDEEVYFEPRFRYDAVKQDFEGGEYNFWDYMILIKGAIKFYREHSSGTHVTEDDVKCQGNHRWLVNVLSDVGDEDARKTYETVIEYKERKQTQRAMRYFIGSCDCADYESRKREGVNPICKHMVYAAAELACLGAELAEILPFPTRHALRLYEKLGTFVYPG